MSATSDSRVIQEFRDRVAKGELTEDVTVSLRLSGGAPSQRLEQEFSLSGGGREKVVASDALRAMPARAASQDLGNRETRELFQQIASGLEGLVPRAEASFLPDSVVGWITIEVDGEQEELFFLADEEDQAVQEKPVASQMNAAVRQIRRMTEQALARE